MSDDQPGLFDLAAVETRAVGPERQGPAARQSSRDRVVWGRYTGPHRACDECVRQRHRGDIAPDAIAAARHRRTYGPEQTLMCDGHRRHWRAADGFDA
jgi:hypothetical protein